ncbi:hypothetical protein ACHAXR_006096, partial [Thalassiosira sp. AJA248-18]
MISIVRLVLLLSQLWIIPPAASSEGSLRGGGGGESRELQPIVNITDIQNQNNRTDIHYQTGHMAAEGMQPFIIGGSKAPTGRHSYTVALVDSRGLFCGGVLICKDMVLTAAHCGIGKSYLEVFAGTSLSGRGEMLYPTKGWIHPSYSASQMNNDFLVYKLESPVRSGAALVTLNQRSNIPSQGGERLVALGWGNTNKYGGYKDSNDLMRVEVGYIPNNVCEGRSGSVGNDFVSYRGQIKKSMLCALSPGKDACQGDSGGPLVKEGSSAGNDILVGISSWGVSCAHSTLPGVYAKVSDQYTWIKSVVCNNSDDPASSFNCGGRNTPDKVNNKPKPKPNNKPGKKGKKGPKK